MDCCNYMPYKNNFYGMPQYFEQMPQYHAAAGEYYGTPYPASEYYGNTPYYSSHPWQCAPPFPDYVYNPKEARIRKAIRDANRERAMGVAPATRAATTARRTQPWLLPEQQDDQFMMTHGMRGVASPMCGNGFPIGGVNPANGQFMGPMHSYNKHIHLAPHEQPYLQTNPMAQLQHQTEMWHYHENSSQIRPQPQAGPFMIPSNQLSAYQHHQHQPPQEIGNIHQAKMKTSTDTYSLPDDSLHSQSPLSNANASPVSEQAFEERKDTRTNNTRTHGQEHNGYEDLELYQEEVIIQNPFEKDESVSIKKNATFPPLPTTKPQKSLPDFNAAFGSTERGRFQSPPVPRFQPKQGYLDFFLTNNDLKFDDFNI